MAYYTLGLLRAKPGNEAELRAAWQALCDRFGELASPPTGPVTLVQSLADPTVHYSFAPWRSEDDARAVLKDARTVEFLENMSELCAEVGPGMFRVVGRSTPAQGT